jgi:hypothetical protein
MSDARDAIHDRAEEILAALCGEGKKVGAHVIEFRVPYRQDRNPSLHWDTEKRQWIDRATKEGGDIFALLGRVKNIDPKSKAGFPQLVAAGLQILGLDPSQFGGKAQRKAVDGFTPRYRREPDAPPRTTAADRESFAAQYGLEWADFESENFRWEVAYGAVNIAYPVHTADGSPLTKFKVADREGGKRKRTLRDKDGNISGEIRQWFRPKDGPAPLCIGGDWRHAVGMRLVITAGEEKMLAAKRVPGVCAISIATGEEIPAGLVPWLLSLGASEIIIAFDADSHGEIAARKGAKLLAEGGHERVRFVVWADDLPRGWDLSDEIQRSGADGLARLFNEAEFWGYDPRRDPWKSEGMAEIYAPQPPIRFLVEDFIVERSVTLFTGDGGSGKTLILQDLAMCVATGRAWLPPGLGADHRVRSRPVLAGPVFWINYDSPSRTVRSRMAAIGRAYGAPADTPIFFFNHPSPILDASNAEMMAELRKRVRFHKPRLIIVDCLSHVIGDLDENASEVRRAVAPFRALAEALPVSVIVIHHHSKEGKFRGSTAIPSNVDLVCSIRKIADADNHEESASPIVEITPTKENEAPIAPFAARLVYTHKPGTKEFATARFDGTAAPEKASEEKGERAWGKAREFAPKPSVKNEAERMDAALSEIVEFVRRNPGATSGAISDAMTGRKGDNVHIVPLAVRHGLIVRVTKPGARATQHYIPSAVPTEARSFLGETRPQTPKERAAMSGERAHNSTHMQEPNDE